MKPPTRHLVVLVNPSLRPPPMPWGKDRPTRRMLMLYLADYMDLVAKRKRRWVQPKVIALYCLIGVGLVNAAVSLLEHEWLFMVLHLASTSLLAWLGVIRKFNLEARLDKEIAMFKQGADETRALIKTRAASWLDVPSDWSELEEE